MRHYRAFLDSGQYGLSVSEHAAGTKRRDSRQPARSPVQRPLGKPTAHHANDVKSSFASKNPSTAAIRIRQSRPTLLLPSTLIRVPRASNVHPRPGFFRPAHPTRPA